MSSASRKTASLSLAISSFLILMASVKGNLQITAFPCAVWVVLTTWPARSKASSPGSKARKRIVACLARWGLPILSTAALTCAVCLVAWRISLHASWQDDRLGLRMAEGEDLVQQGRLVEALAVFQSVDVPHGMPIQMARKHHDCGVVLLQLGRPDEAILHLLTSLQYDPGNAQAAFLVGKVLADRGKREEALHMVRLSLSIDPSFGPARRLQSQLISRGESSRPGEDER